MPKFATLFERLRERGELPVLTEGLLWLSDTLRVLGIADLGRRRGRRCVLEGAAADRRRAHGRAIGSSCACRWPGRSSCNLAVARFCRVLGTLLHNGVPILRSLEISRDATGNRVLARRPQDATENISAGQSLAGPLPQCGHFPPAVVEMIAVAEQANTLETVLVDIADGLERRTWRRLDLLVRLLEPMMLLVLAAVVLVVVIALLLPVIKMSMTV